MARIFEDDKRMILGRTLSRLISECEVDNLAKLNSTIIKKKMCYSATPIYNEWKVAMTKGLLEIIDGNELSIQTFTSKERAEILKHICTD